MYWHGEAVLNAYRAIFTARMESVAAMVTAEMKRVTGVQGSRRVHSRPGEPPLMQTRALNQSITYYVVETDSAVIAGMGTDLAHGRMLETGTSKMAARPWCLASLLNKKEEVRSILRGQRAGAGV